MIDVRALGAVVLTDSAGAVRNLGEFWADRPTVVAFLRHFG